MNGFDLMNMSCYYLEIGQDWLKALGREEGLELPLERRADGRLTEACRGRVTQRLEPFLKRRSWHPRLRVICALGARGITLRRLTLPASGKDELPRLLSLQIESEFPLPPDELAWGYRKLGEARSTANGVNGKQQLLVAAIKRETLEDYVKILAACNASPVFTLAALARSYLCPRPPASYAVLDLGQRSSELAIFEQGVPVTVRVLPWGGQDLAQAQPVVRLASGAAASAGGLADTHPSALAPADPAAPEDGRAPEAASGRAPAAPAPGLAGDGPARPAAQTGAVASLDGLAGALDGQLAGRKLYLTGATGWRPDLASQLAAALGTGTECEALKLAPGEGRSAAILGLKQIIERDGDWPSLIFETKSANGGARVARPAPLKWAALAVALILAALAVPYAEALLLKPRLAGKLAAVKVQKERLGTVDRELDFLRFLKQNQPPYLDAVFVMAKAAPPGLKLDLLSMNRRGEVSWRGSLKDAQQVADFRSKLLDSGCFTNVVVEEQTPSAGGGQPMLMVRMSAQWKAAGGREAFAAAASQMDKAKPAGKETPPGAPAPAAIPPQGVAASPARQRPIAAADSPQTRAPEAEAAAPPQTAPSPVPVK